MKLTDLNFHQTFPPDRGMLSRLLTSDVFSESLTKEEISQRTGIPTGKASGKVEPHIKYASYMGLITDTLVEGKHNLHLTKLGETIAAEDPSLCEEVSIIVCYLLMVSPFGGAPLWEKIVAEILAHNTRGLSKTTIEYTLDKECSNKVNYGPFYSSFDSGLFSPLKILSDCNGSISISKHIFQPDLVFSYAFAFFREWEKSFPNRKELTADELESLTVPAVLGWDKNDFYKAMEYMQDKMLLSFNRQLVPYTVTKLLDSESVISELYNELF